MSVWAFHREIEDKILSRKIKMLLEPLKTGRTVSPASSNYFDSRATSHQQGGLMSHT